ncbi:hypothetical protein CIPAW_09G003700 [Carya illinoinensis]|uniref:Uncharacterized protein n=1 Tax=Carya illinoinensis TaxID=32201 RepID=A0A8T1P8U2_CARIL|nr:hypothetical protein CIPAW_09G003700 [Carya illinoinensis]
MSMWEEPPSSTALFAISPSSLPLFLISSLLSPSSISLSMAPLTSSFFTNTPIFSSSPNCNGSSTPTFTPIFSICTSSFSFINWSPKCGHVTIGIPAHIPSRLEFQPQCVKNPPTEGCDKINNCGAQPRIKRPRPLILSSNPSSKIHFSNSSEFFVSLMTQMKGLFDSSKPSPSSTNCEGIRLQTLPRQA